MSYEVKIICDSVGTNGARLTTFQLRYPRFIHSEVMTHAFVRNASSSRAIPIGRMLQWIGDDPAVPVCWGTKKKGMQAGGEADHATKSKAVKTWLDLMDDALDAAKYLDNLGLHKQVANRLVEPWAHINVVLTGDWPLFANFFSLRCHQDAMPEMQALAVRMARAYRESTPTQLRWHVDSGGEWHMPYVDAEDRAMGFVVRDLLKISVARCARVSYMTFDGKRSTPEDDFALYDRLYESGHWSPFGHQAQSVMRPKTDMHPLNGNYKGWNQFRQMLPKSVYTDFDFSILDTVYRDRDFVLPKGE